MASINDDRTGMRQQGRMADLIVKGAIALVGAAFFIGAHLQFRVSLWLALAGALSVYVTLLMLHSLLRRSEHVDVLSTEVSKLEGELARYRDPTEPLATAGSVSPRKGAPRKAPSRTELRVPPTLSAERGMSSGASLGLGPQLPHPKSAGAPRGQPGSLLDPQPNLSTWPSAMPAVGQKRDYWGGPPEKSASSRPLPPVGPESVGPAPSVGTAPPAAAPAASEREDDLEAVQGMIKRLADEVSLGTDAPGSNEPPQDAAMRASIDALFATADTMRAAANRIAPLSPRRDRDSMVPPPIAPSHARISTIAEAVAAGRMDVLLEPIAGVADNHVHHFEVTVHPRDERGTLVPIAGHDRQLARTGLLPLIDCARLARAAQVLRSFAEQGQKHCVFVAASGEALATDRFLDDLAHMYREREALAAELVLSFTQADLRGFGGIEWSALTDMRDLSFRFALREVTDLDYEFTALKAGGFAFVCLDAGSLLDGLPGPGGIAAGTDIGRHMSDVGMTVVAVGVDNEATRAAMIQCGIRLGQGEAFGPAHIIGARGYASKGIAAA